MLGTKPSVREQRERPAVHRGGGQDKLLQEVTGEQGPHEGRGETHGHLNRGKDTHETQCGKALACWREPQSRYGEKDWPVEFIGQVASIPVPATEGR